MCLKIFVAASFLMTSAASMAATPSAASQQGADSGGKDGVEMVCRRPAADTSTKIRPKKVCLPKAEWEAQSAAAQDSWEENSRKNNLRLPPPQ
jgi:hypothetical protein